MMLVRWLLVPVTAFAVWAGTLLLGIGGSSVLDSFCPPDLMVSGICTASWHRPAMAALEMVCAAVAAVGFIALPAAVAPAYRTGVAVVCFVVGGLLTVELAIAGALWAPAAVAAVAGIMTLWAIISRFRRPTPLRTSTLEPRTPNPRTPIPRTANPDRRTR